MSLFAGRRYWGMLDGGGGGLKCRVALLGVHGVGKTSVARVLVREYGWRLWEARRQSNPAAYAGQWDLMADYLYSLARFMQLDWPGCAVLDNHPLSTVAYALHLHGGDGRAAEFIGRYLDLLGALHSLVGRLDALVLLTADPLVIAERVRRRGRSERLAFTVEDYGRVQELHERLAREHWPAVARAFTSVDTTWERPASVARKIVEYVGGGHP